MKGNETVTKRLRNGGETVAKRWRNGRNGCHFLYKRTSLWLLESLISSTRPWVDVLLLLLPVLLLLLPVLLLLLLLL